MGIGRLRKMAKYRDNDLVNFDFPPPNANVQLYIDEEISTPTPTNDDSLPTWVKDVARVLKIQDMEEAAKIMQAKFNSALERIEGLKAEVVLKDKELIQIRLELQNIMS